MAMKTSATGRAVLMDREGVRLKAYRDSVGVLTIGTGHTGRASAPAVTEGMTITRAQADAFLAADLIVFEKTVNAAVKVKLTQNQFDACVSLAFNVGGSGFSGSTVVRRINAGLMAEAADAFLLWKKPAAIIPRRQAEREQFLTPYTEALPKARTGEAAVVVSDTPDTTTAVSAAPVASVPPVAQAPSKGLFAWIKLILRKV